MRIRSLVSAAWLVPGRRRPITVSQLVRRDEMAASVGFPVAIARCTTGTHTSALRPISTPEKVLGTIPTMAKGALLKTTVAPDSSGRERPHARHNRSLTTATGGRPGLSSSSPMGRPEMVRTPRVVK